MKDVELVKLAKGEEQQASSVLSIAMVSNPIHVAVLQGQGETERGRLKVMFMEMLIERPREVFVAKHDSTIIGVVRSQECHGEQAKLEQVTVKNEIDEAALNDTDSRIAHWLSIWDEHDPPEPHRHLGPVGVLPQFQGHGIGSKMMESFCAKLDANSEPGYLETDRSENVGFYERFRFRVVGETDIFDIRTYFMWRPAQ
jgi:ribosomal protein S18 acetylase RimI-like enzyme